MRFLSTAWLDVLGLRPLRIGQERADTKNQRFLCALIVMLGLAIGRPGWAQQPLPIDDPSVTLPSLTSEALYTVDLGSLPNRAALIVEVTPDIDHPDMQIQIEATNWLGFEAAIPLGDNCPSATTQEFSPASTGPAKLDYSLTTCAWVSGVLEGATTDVLVRAISFGSEGAPANVRVVIRGETRVPTGTLAASVETNLSTQQISLMPTKDATIYRSNPSGSNGAGSTLWSGTDFTLLPVPSFNPLRTLIAFDVVGSLPFNAVITDADLRFFTTSIVGGGGTVSLFEVAEDLNGETWAEGTTVPQGVQFFAAPLNGSASTTWNDRRRTEFSIFAPWNSPGGDLSGPALAQTNVATSFSTASFSSPAFTNSLQSMVDRGNDQDGFILLGPAAPITNPADTAVSFSSRTTGPLFGPRLVVNYVPAEPFSTGTLNTGVNTFVNEGEDFRWIYDLDADDTYVTPINGVCEVTSGGDNFLPFRYSFEGTPGFTGVDCCTWQIDAPSSQTIGTGQALFFHNLDPNELPPDTDADGIVDTCDNCIAIPNGPALGTCISASGVGGTCHSNLECGSGETCSLSQDDADLDTEGDACEVPEPGLLPGIAAGIVGLSLVLRGRRE